jgi:hypothetical protein
VKATDGDRRRDRGCRNDRERGPQQQTQQMLLLSLKERVGPHMADASLAVARQEGLLTSLK